ncbi:hypothetical protein BESB_036120 [Besnoitia besnoiti]|uniref:Uncharacterized protein n=1 Tax=Besnoitia besnoiti TaxID=94643 RepID=A0A2A9MIY0_BESBE|nr:hypothetical protein BESB_036120 [Besnoitia besnoiti]PFH37154.1 hypothetical protein BESB_036120 [Besnoitia besnoiti]
MEQNDREELPEKAKHDVKTWAGPGEGGGEAHPRDSGDAGAVEAMEKSRVRLNMDQKKRQQRKIPQRETKTRECSTGEVAGGGGIAASCRSRGERTAGG